MVRAPNLITAATNVCSGFVLMAAVDDSLFSSTRFHYAVVLMFISVCLYASGAVFNDLVDLERDRRFRPERPLASGAIGVRQAYMLGAGLIACGLFAAMFLSHMTVLVAGMIVAASWLYNGLAKYNMLLGAVTMGICRGLNMLLGMSTGQSWEAVLICHEMLWAPCLLGLYTFIFTVSAHYEDSPAGTTGRWVLFGAAAGMPMVLLGVAFKVIRDWDGWIVIGLTILAISAVFVMVLMRITFAAVRRAIGAAVILIIAFDAAIVLGTPNAPAWLGLLVLSAILPASLLARRLSPS